MTSIAFLDQLATARSDSEFTRTAAGFAILHVYDSVRTHGFDAFAHEEALQRIGRDVKTISPESNVRAALQSLIEVLPFWEISGRIRVGRKAVYTALLIYGQALGDEGEWRIAGVVFAQVGMDAELDGETWLAAEGRLLMGRACRMCADWELSRAAYRRAYELGMDARDFSVALRARIGEANNLWGRGDFPAAKRLLAATARRARKSCPSVIPRVTLAMAGVANAAGEYERAIQLAFDLQRSLPDDDELKYQTLVDLAIFLTDYGLPPVAAAALRLVEHAAPEPRVRRQATLNLFFLAAHYEAEPAFRALHDQLGAEPLSAREQTQYALFAAQGFRRFGQLDAARASAQLAIQLATKFEFFQLIFEAEAKLREINDTRVETNDVDAVAVARSAKPRRGAVGANMQTKATRYRSTTGSKLSPRMLLVAESLENMASEFALTDTQTSKAF